MDALNFANAYYEKYGENISNSCPIYNKEYLKQLCLKCRIEFSYVLRSLGTLGGGNHYIEVNRNDEMIDYITIHSGSRSIGDKVCLYHQEKINKTRRFDYWEYKDKLKQFERKHKTSKSKKMYSDSLREEFEKCKHEDYLEGIEAFEYFFDMIFCQKNSSIE